jgi:hypothetical protein
VDAGSGQTQALHRTLLGRKLRGEPSSRLRRRFLFDSHPYSSPRVVIR